MITIHFDGLNMTASGHAGFASPGQDIVCAGVSALAFAAAEYLTQMRTWGKLEREPVIALEPGEIRLECEPKITAEEEASHVFRMLEIGCRLIAHSYPNNVIVTDVTDMGSPTYGQI